MNGWQSKVKKKDQKGQMSSEEASQRRESQGRLGERREASLVKGESKRRQTAGEGRARGGLGGDQQN